MLIGAYHGQFVVLVVLRTDTPLAAIVEQGETALNRLLVVAHLLVGKQDHLLILAR